MDLVLKYENTDLARPEGLSVIGKKTWEAIIKRMEEFCGEKGIYTGGSKAFYSPQEWTKRGEAYGKNSELIVVYEGGDLGQHFSYDYCQYGLIEDMVNPLCKVGSYTEACTGWYSAVYEG